MINGATWNSSEYKSVTNGSSYSFSSLHSLRQSSQPRESNYIQSQFFLSPTFKTEIVWCEKYGTHPGSEANIKLGPLRIWMKSSCCVLILYIFI